MPKLTEQQKQEYVQAGGVRCPFCKSDQIDTTSPVETDAGIAWQDLICNACGEDWVDHYKLCDIDQDVPPGTWDAENTDA